MIRPDGAWIFLSHSNDDWDQVRTVRNLLEEKGQKLAAAGESADGTTGDIHNHAEGHN